jgi:FtsP/CotA-like multicopper oxidase with cupredoxin domain
MNKDDRSVLMWGSFGVAIAALFVAIASMTGLGDTNTSSSSDSGTGPTIVDVQLSEFAITPAAIVVPPGAVQIRVTNIGAVVHNLSIPNLGKKTADINPGESETLDLGTLTEGAMDMLCEIAGHASSGMVGTLSVTSGVDPTDSGTTEVDWEVEPGKIVTAMTYNGTVPGPEIRVNVGDKVRIVVTNELRESTSVHFHGIRVPNKYDGVDPYTQKPIMPGETFTYEWTTVEPEVGIYHSHHDAQAQIPDGLFGSFMVGEMPIPDVLKEKGYTQVDKEVTMTLNDSGAIGLSLNGKSFPATEAYTLRLGQVMMVHYQNEGLMGHPMHMHQPVGWIVAKDGVPLLVPQPADTIWVSPGERYTVLYKAVDPGVWAWHCHILSHAEGPQGMFGMVTALIITP